MTNRPWFIFKGDHHLGPFSTSEIKQKLKLREIDGETFLWKEGEPGWRKSSTFELFFPRPKVVVEKSPALPPLPESLETSLPPVPQIEEEIELPPAPLEVQEDKAIVSKDELKAFFVKERKIQEKKQREVLKEEIKEKRSLRFSLRSTIITFSALMLISVGAIYFSLKTFSPRPDAYDGLSRGQVERLERFSVKDVDANKMEVSFDLTESQSSLWITINPAISTNAILTLTSISGEVLEDDKIYQGDILAISETKIKKGRGKFDVFRLVKGERLLEGRYQVNLSLMNKNSSLSQSNWSEILKWSDGKGFTQVKTSFLWGRLSQSDFDKKLEKIKEERSLQRQNKIDDRLEKYKTYRELTHSLIRIYKQVVQEIKRPADISRFEVRYAKEIGPILQSIIIEAINTSSDLSASDEKASDLYAKLSEHGKMIGEMASDMATMTAKSKNFESTGRNRLINLFESRANELSERSQKAIEFLEKNP